MGIVNLTPDSFSDGGLFHAPAQAIDHARRLLNDGADILDLGAESTRPGASAVGADEEWRRLQPVLNEVLRWQVPISVDTFRPETMRRALDLGVDIINDIWALRQPGALIAVAQSRAGVCLMHMHGEPVSMQISPMAGDAVPQVRDFLRKRLAEVQAAGVTPQRVTLDPGIGFGKTVEQNFSLLARQAELTDLGPLLAGWSRKSSLGTVTGLDVSLRMPPSVVAAVLAAERGAAVLRVHDVAETVAGLAVWRQLGSV
ncbi:MAG: dihydropteroate synthase [Alphaproteobacteria bacterium]|nr:dihydropteroate synthase [Alphaproteobacteria bacterium]